MDINTKIIIIRIISFLIWILSLTFVISVSTLPVYANPCSSCELDIPIGFVLKITTLKASDKNTLKRWTDDFINSYKVIKIDKSKFPEFITLYYIEKNKNK